MMESNCLRRMAMHTYFINATSVSTTLFGQPIEAEALAGQNDGVYLV